MSVDTSFVETVMRSGMRNRVVRKQQENSNPILTKSSQDNALNAKYESKKQKAAIP